MTYKTICKCDHDKDSHYKETDPSTLESKRTACLARGCECKAYNDPLNPPKPKRKPRQEQSQPQLEMPAPPEYAPTDPRNPDTDPPPSAPSNPWCFP